MSVQRYTLPSGAVRYRARVKSQGREVAARVFDRKADAVAWEQDQRRRLRLGEWVDPRRGRVPLSAVAADWLSSRNSVKRRTRESDEAARRNYIQPRFGNWPVASITAAEVSAWLGGLVARGLAPSTATRALATLPSILAFAVADGRVLASGEVLQASPLDASVPAPFVSIVDVILPLDANSRRGGRLGSLGQVSGRLKSLRAARGR